MTDENLTKPRYNTEDIGIYRPTALIPEFLEKGDKGSLESTIEILYEKIGVREKDRRDLAALVLSDQGVLDNFTQRFSGKYHQALNYQALKSLRGFYSGYFTEYFTGENLSKVDKVFDSDESYESVLIKFNNASQESKLLGDENNERVEKAKKDLKELSKIVVPLREFEDLEIDKIRKPAYKKSLRNRLNHLYEEEKPESS